jgi:hypothetical protein
LARAYREILDYRGWENGDSYPLTDLKREELRERYKEHGGNDW